MKKNKRIKTMPEMVLEFLFISSRCEFYLIGEFIWKKLIKFRLIVQIVQI